MTIQPKYYLEDLEVGMFSETTMDITAEKIDAFADIVGDHNPLHVDEEFAKQTQFGQRIAHGALSSSLISAILGNDLPGPGAVFVELNLRFRKPAFIGDTVVGRAEITEINERTGRVKIKCTCSVGDKQLSRGYAGVLVQKRPKD